MATNPTDSSLRYVTGTQQPISCTILSNDDPLHLGRLLVYPDHWDQSKVPLEKGLWAHTESPDPQTAGVGETRHVYHLAGSRGHIEYDHNGTCHFRRAATSYSGGDAPPGSTQAPEGQPGYPSNVDRKY